MARRSSRRRRQRSRSKRRQRGGGTNFTVVIQPGTELKSTPIDIPIENAQTTPAVSWSSTGDLYTLICSDPDAANKSWLHWLVVNCGGNGPESGRTIQAWSGPSPPNGETHRYYFKVLKQSGEITPAPINERGGFDVDAFIRQNGLTPMADRMMRVKGI